MLYFKNHINNNFIYMVWCFFMFYIILLLIPNLIYFFKTFDYSSLFLSIIIVFFLSIFKKTKYFGVFFSILFFLPMVIFYLIYYGDMPGEQVFGIISETNYHELIGYFGNWLLVAFVIFLIWCISLFFILCLDCKYNYTWDSHVRYFIAFVFIFYFLFSYNITNIKVNDGEAVFLMSENNLFIDDVRKTFPVGLFFAINKWRVEQNKINEEFKRNMNFKFNAIKEDVDLNETIVLVVGETSRRDNWSLNGYSRETNPLLSKQKNLINLSNMISISNATSNSIPMLLTRKPAEKVNNYDFSEKSIISAFKEAGYETYWVSMQQKFGNNDTTTSIYAKEADHILFLNNTDYKNKGGTDDMLLPAVEKITNDNLSKKFIIIHMLGSHFDYAHRYPVGFDYFKPSLNDLNSYSLQNIKYKTELVNSYDNSIMFTDYVLNNIINILAKNSGASFLFYSSDHGESLFDNGCNGSGHGLNYKNNFEISSFVWYSDSYFLNKTNEINYLISNKDKKISQISVFPTLLDAGGIKIKNYYSDKSLLGILSEYPRIVMGGLDFDKVNIMGECMELQR